MQPPDQSFRNLHFKGAAARITLPAMDTSTPDLAAWIGRSETLRDTITEAPLRALDATLDHAPREFARGLALPPL